MPYKFLLAVAALATGTVAQADYRNTVDEDGCWDGKTSNGDACLSRTMAERSGASGSRLEVAFVNRCTQSVYAQICIQRLSGARDDCGSSTVAPNREFKYYNTQSTGRYRLN